MTTSAKPQSHGHQHGHVFNRVLQKSQASSGSSLNTATLGAADSKALYAASCVAVLIDLLESVDILPTTTGTAYGPNCFGRDCDATNSTHYSNHFTHPTPVPQLQPQASKVQDGQLASLLSLRSDRYRVPQISGIDEASRPTGLGLASPGPMPVKIKGTYWPLTVDHGADHFSQQILHQLGSVYGKPV